MILSWNACGAGGMWPDPVYHALTTPQDPAGHYAALGIILSPGAPPTNEEIRTAYRLASWWLRFHAGSSMCFCVYCLCVLLILHVMSCAWAPACMH